MAFKDVWTDLRDATAGIAGSGDDITVKPINDIAHAVIDMEENKADKTEIPKVEGLASEVYVNEGLSKKANKSDLAVVATSGNYNDLTNTPEIPSIDGLASEQYVNEGLNKKADKTTKINGKPLSGDIVLTADDVGALSSDKIVEGFGVPFDVSGTGLVSIDKVHPKEHDVEVLTDAESVTVLGKNMIPFPYMANYKEHNGVTFVVNDDGTVTANGTATAQAYIAIANKSLLNLSNGTYCLSGTPSENNEDYKCYIIYAGISQDGRTDGKVITINDSTSQNFMTCVVSAGKTVNNFVFKPMLEVGTQATEFELYKKATYPVTDGKAIVKSVSPTMNITSATSGASIEAKGYQDGLAVIDELKQAIISLGGNV